MYILGIMYIKGIGFNYDYIQGIDYLLKSAENGNKSAQYQLSEMYHIGIGVDINISESIEWNTKMVEQRPDYLTNWYINDVDKTFEELLSKDYLIIKDSATSGNSKAMYCLGIMYILGIGVEFDNNIGINWVTKSAEAGFANAQCELGDIYMNGLNVEKNAILALKWYMKASDQGTHPAARGDEMLQKIYNILNGE